MRDETDSGASGVGFWIIMAAVIGLMVWTVSCSDSSSTAACARRGLLGECLDPTPAPTSEPAPTPTPTPTPPPQNGPCPFQVHTFPAPVPDAWYVFSTPEGPTVWVVNGVNVPTPLGVLFNVPAGTIVTACRVPCGCLAPFPIQ